MLDDEVFHSFWGHVEELRKTILRILFIIAIGFVLSLFFYQSLFAFFTPFPKKNSDHPFIKESLERERVFNPSDQPLLYQLPEKAIVPEQAGIVWLESQTYRVEGRHYLYYEIPKQEIPKLLIINPIEGFLLTLQVCFWVSLALTSPIWVYILLQFILPGLKRKEKRLLLPFVLGSFMAISLGFSLAYFVTLPLANQYFETFNAEIGQNAWVLSYYVQYTLVVFLGHAIAFEICLGLLFLVHLQILSVQWLVSKRRHMIVVAFILGALLTPPDVPSQLMLAIPLIIVYELAILYGKLRASWINKNSIITLKDSYLNPQLK